MKILFSVACDIIRTICYAGNKGKDGVTETVKKKRQPRQRKGI